MANHVNGLDEIDMEYTLDAWGDVPPLHARELYAQYDATRAEFVAPDTCHKLHARIAELERERDAAQGALEFAQRYWMDAIAERDAANKRAKEYVGVFKRVNAAKRVWRKRAEQAEAFRSAFAEWILRQSEDVKFSAAMALGSEYLDGAK